MPFLNDLNNDRIKKILVSTDALHARIALCDFYCAKAISTQLLEKTIQLLEDAIKQTKKQRDVNEFDDFDF